MIKMGPHLLHTICYRINYCFTMFNSLACFTLVMPAIDRVTSVSFKIVEKTRLTPSSPAIVSP